MALIAIGELARITGAKVNTIRFYEEKGLLPLPVRTSSGRRTYGADDISRLHFIRRARSLGFGLDEIGVLLSLSSDRDRPCDEVDQIARRNLADVRSKIDDLLILEGELSKLIDQCGRGTVQQCGILGALTPPQ